MCCCGHTGKLQWFLKLVTEAKEVPSAAQVDGLIGKALKAVPNDEWFTASFDKRTYNSRYKRAMANRRRQQVKKIGIAKKKNFKGAPGRSAMSRKDVAVLHI